MKVSLSERRFNRLSKMPGVIPGYAYSQTKDGNICAAAFKLNNHVYTITKDKNGELLFVRYKADSNHNLFAFQPCTGVHLTPPF